MERTKHTERNEFGLPNIVIPAEVLANDNLSPREMILFGYLLNMTYNEYGYCWASNHYLSRIIGVAPETVSAMISKLAKEQYVHLEYMTIDGKEMRRIFINNQYPEIYREKLKQVHQRIKTPLRKTLTPIKENLNTSKGKSYEPLSETLNNINIDINNRDNILLSGDEIPDSSIDGKNELIPPIKERNKEFLPLAKKLSEIIQSNKNIKYPTHTLYNWADEIRKLVESNGVTRQRIDDSLDWYAKNIGGQYVPVIESGTSLRSKFIKLEDAIKRSKSNGHERPYKIKRAVHAPEGKYAN